MPKVSVVIPIYNVGPYIERCLHSIFGQTLRDIEYVFVDDGSTDNSVELIYKTIEEYPYRKNQICILRHSINQGVGITRADGIKASTGEYIIHCDPDDYAELDMYEKMYNTAVETQADIVVCQFFVEASSGTSVVRKKYADSPRKCLENMYKKDMHCGALYEKLVRRDLIVRYNIIPYDGCNYAEDFYCVVKMLFYARSLAVVEQPLYHYCRRNDSITAMLKDECNWNIRKEVTDRICEFLKSERRYRIFCNQIRFYIKMEYRCVFARKEREWYELYRESHDSILRYNDMPLKARLLWFVALRSYLTYRITKKLVRGI